MTRTGTALAVPGHAGVPPTRIRPLGSASGRDLLQAVALAENLRAAVVKVAILIRRDHFIDVEWWAPAADGASLQIELSSGDATGPRVAVSIGAAGMIVLVGERASGAVHEVARLRPLLHHWWTAEQLAEHVTRLARRNEALEDFAALVAHDVRSSLVSASGSDAPGEILSRTLELVDSILEAARAEAAVGEAAPLADAVRGAVADLGDTGIEIITSVTGHLPLPASSLRFVLRNLLANAVAAGARTVHVSALAQGDRHVLAVADDGVGLGTTDGYSSGTQLGVALCRRLLARFGGTLVLKRRGTVGTCAVVAFAGAPQ